MDSFFDTNVIINYAYYHPNSKNEVIKRCFLHIKNKKDHFVICYFVERELSNVLKHRAVIYKEVLEKIKNESHNFEDSKFLSKQEVRFAKKLYVRFKNLDLNAVSKILSEERTNLEIRIEYFLETLLDEKVIPLGEINGELVNIVRDFISNHADCKVVASAIHYRMEIKKDFLLVTVDDEHLDSNTYDFIKKDRRLKNYEFPTLLNLYSWKRI